MSAAEDFDFSALTEKQRRFVNAYADHANGTRAALQAGYSEHTAYSIAHENLKKPEIADAIKIRRKQLVEEAGVRPDGVLRMIAAIATFDISEVFDSNGRIREISEMSDVARRVVAGIETFTVGTRDGSSHTTTSKIKLPDRLKALELLARHLGLFDDQVTVKGDAANPFELIIRQAQGTALVPVTQREQDDSANEIDDCERLIEGEVIERSDTPSQDMASGDTLAAFNNISEDDDTGDDDGAPVAGASSTSVAPAVAQTKEDVERAAPESERHAFKSLWKRPRRRNV